MIAAIMNTRTHHRPIIGIVAHTDLNRFKMPATTIPVAYTQGVEKAGGIPLILPFTGSPDPLGAMADAVHGFLFPGGNDVNPKFYHEAPAPGLGEVDTDLDRFQIGLLGLAMEREMPVLAVCRGIQLVNVALGGTLYQDIPSQIPSSRIRHTQEKIHFGTDHGVAAEAGSRLHQWFGPEIRVNSRHHQAVRELGKDLVVTARAPDGVVEGAQHTRLPMDLVQWHPELMMQTSDDMLPLFTALVENSRQWQKTKGRS